MEKQNLEIKHENMENVKAFFIDLDGTLLDAKDKKGKLAISEENLNAIKKVQEEGKTVVVSTGRSFDAEGWLKQVNSPYAVLSNGAIVVVEDKIVRHLKLSVRQSLLIHEFAWKNGLSFKLNDQKIAYGAFKFLPRLFAKKHGFIPQDNFNFEMHKEHTKFVLFGKSKSKMAKLIKQLSKKIPDAAIVTSAGGYTIEVTHADATKGKGNQFIYEKYLKLPMEQTMHIGDTMNDSTTIGFVGKMVALKNSDRNLKVLTPYAGPHYKNAGVAKVINGKFTKNN